MTREKAEKAVFNSCYDMNVLRMGKEEAKRIAIAETIRFFKTWDNNATNPKFKKEESNV